MSKKGQEFHNVVQKGGLLMKQFKILSFTVK